MSAILIGVLRDPAAARGLAPGDWDLLLRQAASADMLATLAHWLSEAGLLEQIPGAPRATRSSGSAPRCTASIRLCR